MDGFVNRAEGHLLLDEFDAAISDFQKAREKDQNSRQALEGLQRAQRLQKMAKRKDYYKILGVSKDVSVGELRKAYRKLALEWHPGPTQFPIDLFFFRKIDFSLFQTNTMKTRKQPN